MRRHLFLKLQYDVLTEHCIQKPYSGPEPPATAREHPRPERAHDCGAVFHAAGRFERHRTVLERIDYGGRRNKGLYGNSGPVDSLGLQFFAEVRGSGAQNNAVCIPGGEREKN